MKNDNILIYDDIFTWDGWGGRLRLGSGRCRMRIFNLTKGDTRGLTFLKPVIVIITDVPDSRMTIRSCTSHIATVAVSSFKLDRQRMLWVEYYPRVTYGEKNHLVIPERFEQVEFTWHEDSAIKPVWKPVRSPLLETVKALVARYA